jgi:hypothetical protein
VYTDSGDVPSGSSPIYQSLDSDGFIAIVKLSSIDRQLIRDSVKLNPGDRTSIVFMLDRPNSDPHLFSSPKILVNPDYDIRLENRGIPETRYFIQSLDFDLPFRLPVVVVWVDWLKTRMPKLYARIAQRVLEKIL